MAADRNCATTTATPATATATATAISDVDYSEYKSYSMPLAGLGLGLAEGGQPCGTDFGDALRACTVPPIVDVGLRYPDLPYGGHPNILGYIYESWLEKGCFPGAPSPDAPGLKHLGGYETLAPLLPLISLPATGDDWVAVEHFSLLLRRLAVGDVDLGALRPYETWPHAPRGPLPYVRPRGRGAVTPEIVSEFADRFAWLAEAIGAAIPWSGAGAGRSAPARLANAAASRLLGTPVDLRVGTLVSDRDISDCLGYAGGEVTFDGGDSLAGRLEVFLERHLPTVKPGLLGRRAAELDGAAWSCDVDRLLSVEEAWSPR